ncbi:hypothetical protein [Apilactobacillus quenuiae]|uniref:hypothetical protein n=1 Tax=Apilactobacillus quenuiae TaxID=2008377 RepID=UPI000D0160A2|nr:hypothetical protein [Apilactobacillus quenuiae]
MYKYISIIFRTISVILSVMAGMIIGLDIIPIEPIAELPTTTIIYDVVGIAVIILLICQIIAAFFIRNTQFDFLLAIIMIVLTIALWFINPDIKFPYICTIIANVALVLGN